MTDNKKFGWPFGKQGYTIKINQNVTSYGQTGGITAHTVHLGQQARRLSNDAKHQLIAALSANPGSFTMLIAAGVGDGGQLAADIEAVFHASGWTRGFSGTFSNIATGVQLRPRSERGAAAATAINSLGLPCHVAPLSPPEFGGEDIHIMIGSAN